MIGKRGGVAGKPAQAGHNRMHQRQISVLKRKSAVPIRPPETLAEVFGDGDKRPFNRTNLVGVFDGIQLSGDEEVDDQDHQLS